MQNFRIILLAFGLSLSLTLSLTRWTKVHIFYSFLLLAPMLLLISPLVIFKTLARAAIENAIFRARTQCKKLYLEIVQLFQSLTPPCYYHNRTIKDDEKLLVRKRKYLFLYSKKERRNEKDYRISPSCHREREQQQQ